MIVDFVYQPAKSTISSCSVKVKSDRLTGREQGTTFRLIGLCFIIRVDQKR